MADREQVFVENTGLDDLINFVKKVAAPPSFLVTGKLESTLQEAFVQTQDQVHVISGRLKASGHTDTDFDGYTWTGEIKYGGRTGTPAYYAIYEMNRGGTRPDGTPHDWFTGLEVYDKKFEDAIDDHFKNAGKTS